MKSFFCLAALLLCTILLQAQKIKYESSFETAKAAALQQQKPLAVLLTMQVPAVPPDFMKGLNDKTVVEKFNTSFINYTVAREDSAASRKIIIDYKINRFPSFLFLDAKGGLLFNDPAFVSRAASLLETADKAILASKEKSLSDYDSAFHAGSSEPAFLKAYILRRRTAGITDNANLIEKYVTGIAVADLNNYIEVLFILKAGPLVDSSAYKLVNVNRRIIDSIFKKEPLPDRVAMNNASIQNTMANAIATKNMTRAQACANFTRNSWTNNYAEGQKNWQLKMMQYFGGIKDTASYLRHAVAFYEQYYMRISADSIRKKDSLDLETVRNRARQNASVIASDSTGRTFTFSVAKNAVATELNNAAWYFYTAAGNNNDYLMKAMLWSRRSIELNPNPAFYDTYAHLLYRLQFFEEAESMQNKAIEAGKAAKTDTRLYQEEYKKIKAKTL
ncbi:MAG: hypothetical protein ABIQ88_20930 [Chitinophagaceae bacterium]